MVELKAEKVILCVKDWSKETSKQTYLTLYNFFKTFNYETLNKKESYWTVEGRGKLPICLENVN